MSHLPLPLELAQPVLLADDLDTQIRTDAAAAGYDPKTQLCNGGRGGTSCKNQSKSTYNLLVIDLQFDVQIDDVLNN
jgi:hypothetical protein